MSYPEPAPYHVTPDRVSAALSTSGWFCHHFLRGEIPVTCSIGLQGTALPFDIVIIGLEEHLSRGIISALKEKACELLSGISPDGRINGLLEGLPVRLSGIPEGIIKILNEEIAEGTGRQVDKVALLQVPDPMGLLPDDEGCDPTFARIQDFNSIRMAS